MISLERFAYVLHDAVGLRQQTFIMWEMSPPFTIPLFSGEVKFHRCSPFLLYSKILQKMWKRVLVCRCCRAACWKLRRLELSRQFVRLIRLHVRISGQSSRLPSLVNYDNCFSQLVFPDCMLRPFYIYMLAMVLSYPQLLQLNSPQFNRLTIVPTMIPQSSTSSTRIKQ
jgi:hypothetical protein